VEVLVQVEQVVLQGLAEVQERREVLVHQEVQVQVLQELVELQVLRVEHSH
jgi:hypothetical protein